MTWRSWIKWWLDRETQAGGSVWVCVPRKAGAIHELAFPYIAGWPFSSSKTWIRTGNLVWSKLCTPLVAQTVKRLSTIRETWVRSLGRDDSLEKEMATHSSNIAWKIPWTEDPGRLQSMGPQRVGHDWVTSLSYGYTTFCLSFCQIQDSRLFPVWGDYK